MKKLGILAALATVATVGTAYAAYGYRQVTTNCSSTQSIDVSIQFDTSLDAFYLIDGTITLSLIEENSNIGLIKKILPEHDGWTGDWDVFPEMLGMMSISNDLTISKAGDIPEIIETMNNFSVVFELKYDVTETSDDGMVMFLDVTPGVNTVKRELSVICEYEEGEDPGNEKYVSFIPDSDDFYLEPIKTNENYSSLYDNGTIIDTVGVLDYPYLLDYEITDLAGGDYYSDTADVIKSFNHKITIDNLEIYAITVCIPEGEDEETIIPIVEPPLEEPQA